VYTFFLYGYDSCIWGTKQNGKQSSLKRKFLTAFNQIKL
jgi:hypothetical protein